jgi:hypothetical protein
LRRHGKTLMIGSAHETESTLSVGEQCPHDVKVNYNSVKALSITTLAGASRYAVAL